jgi:hypothetical protein
MGGGLDGGLGIGEIHGGGGEGGRGYGGQSAAQEDTFLGRRTRTPRGSVMECVEHFGVLHFPSSAMTRLRHTVCL